MTLMKNLIGGEWIETTNAKTDTNPSDLADAIGEYVHGDAAQTSQAITAARTAFSSWSRIGIQQRAEILDTIGNEILTRKDEFGTLLSREEGKTLPEGIGETVRAGNIFKFFAGEVLRQTGDRIPSVRPGVDVEVTREPIGVVGIITPWNFPIAIPAWKIAPALAYGNCVVFKPADLVPATAWALAEVISRSGIPEGVFNLVMGRGSVVGEAVIESPNVDGISFTGSVETGRHLAEKATQTMKKVQLEMGGKNPLVILDDADLDIAVDVAIQGAFYSTGQRCTASSRLIVTERIHDEFVTRVIDTMNKLVVDHALKDGTQIGPVVDDSQLQQDLQYLAIGQEEGATLAFGGDLVERDTEGYFMRPALLVDTNNAMRINREEIFGPVASVIKVHDYDEALATANDTEFGLSSGIVTTSLKHASHFKRNADAGMVMVNLPTAGVDYHVPFGGRKGSSYGSREQGRYAVEFFTTVKTSYIRP